MKASLFDYDLPEDLVAQYPPAERDSSRLMVLPRNGGPPLHRTMRDLPELLPPGTLLVANDTRVVPARLRGRRPTGGAVEALIVRALPSSGPGCRFSALVRANRPIRTGDRLLLGDIRATVAERLEDGQVSLDFDVDEATLRDHMEVAGEVPLPPYIRRRPMAADRDRYQTIFARRPGSVAAPTAGLHFTEALVRRLAERGFDLVFVTLHVGPGTFRPISAEDTSCHRMEPEAFVVGEDAARAVSVARREGRPIVAVGTTVVRALEGLVHTRGAIEAGAGWTDLFVEPGFRFRVVDGLLTNFHLPRSTLVCLVSALVGRERLLDAYREAMARGYRFYSYGDAMLVWPEEER